MTAIGGVGTNVNYLISLFFDVLFNCIFDIVSCVIATYNDFHFFILTFLFINLVLVFIHHLTFRLRGAEIVDL